MAEHHDNANGPCACGAWHKPDPADIEAARELLRRHLRPFTVYNFDGQSGIGGVRIPVEQHDALVAAVATALTARRRERDGLVALRDGVIEALGESARHMSTIPLRVARTVAALEAAQRTAVEATERLRLADAMAGAARHVQQMLGDDDVHVDEGIPEWAHEYLEQLFAALTAYQRAQT